MVENSPRHRTSAVLVAGSWLSGQASQVGQAGHEGHVGHVGQADQEGHVFQAGQRPFNNMNRLPQTTSIFNGVQIRERIYVCALNMQGVN